MKNQSKKFGTASHLLRNYWIGGLAVLLIAFVLFKGAPAWAAPLNQTVPQPTATKENTPVPQATNTPKRDKDHNDDNNQPTATPVPQQPAATPAAEQPTVTTAPQQPVAGNGPTGLVNAENRLNVRQGPGTNFAIVGHVTRGEVVTIQQRDAAGTWLQVCCASDTQSAGWVSAQFIQLNFDAAQLATLVPVAGEVTAPTVAAPTAPAATQAVTPTATIASGAVVTPTATVAPAAAVTESTATTATVSAATDVTETDATTSPLVLTIEQMPALAWQGQTLQLGFVLTNTGSVLATNVELRDELPEELTLVSATAGGEGKVAPVSSASKNVLDIQWPQLAAGDTLTATITVRIADKTPDGSVIDNLAVVAADGLGSNTAGITIGLPPTNLPDFQ